MDLERYVEAISALRIGRSGEHPRPHKPALLLAIISLVESGQVPHNRILYGPELFEVFRHYFQAVRSPADAVNMLDPFWRLRTDGLLLHQAKPGFEAAVAAQSTAPSLRQLREITTGSRLPENLFNLLQDPTAREQFREAIISRFFPQQRDVIMRIIGEEQAIGQYEHHLESTPSEHIPAAETPVREQAFRRVVLRAYDYRCAACGVRVVLDDLVLVEAAHLVPWYVTHDDDPRNGISLCKNHHWAMDCFLIAPSPPPRRVWKVSASLDDRIEGQRDLLDLDDRTVITPRDEKYSPKEASLAWRFERLLTTDR